MALSSRFDPRTSRKVIGVAASAALHLALLLIIMFGGSQYGIDKIAPEFTASEADTTSAGQLSTAAINGQFDATYVGLLQDKLAATQTLAQKVKDGAHSEIGAVAEQTIKTVQSLSKRLQDTQL